jgi:multiple sugar transport system permease protein
MRKLNFINFIFRHFVLITGAVFILAPFIWMISTSFKPEDEIFSSTIRLLPHHWYIWENYRDAFTKEPLLRYMINGVFVTASIFVLQMTFAIPAAYALAKLKFKAKKIFFWMVLFSLLIPPHVTAIPVYLELFKMGALDTYAALILPWSISVFSIFLIRQFLKTIPDDLINAARVDGMGEITILFRVIIPSSLPVITACGIASVIAHWNDYFWPLIAINSTDLYTPPLGVTFFRDEIAGTDYGPLMAAATVIILPLVVGFLFAQDKFIKGISTQAGIK